jgi:hypothetical protein
MNLTCHYRWTIAGQIERYRDGDKDRPNAVEKDRKTTLRDHMAITTTERMNAGKTNTGGNGEQWGWRMVRGNEPGQTTRGHAGTRDRDAAHQHHHSKPDDATSYADNEDYGDARRTARGRQPPPSHSTPNHAREQLLVGWKRGAMGRGQQATRIRTGWKGTSTTNEAGKRMRTPGMMGSGPLPRVFREGGFYH